MSSYILTVHEGGRTSHIPADGQETLLSALGLGGSAIHAPCGGNGTCRQCSVTVTGPCRGRAGAVRVYENETVLACRCRPAGDLTVTVESSAGAQILTGGRAIPPCGEGLGLAVDIGATTVAEYLYDLETGACLQTCGAMNAQRPYGSDVISRIHYASSPGGLSRLHGAIRTQVSSLARQLCGDRRAIRRVSIAGNTVMEHLFAGLSPESIGSAPFTPLSLFGREVPADDVLDGFAPDCTVYLCPAVAGYVGGDITAGLLSSRAYLDHQTVLFLDIGTNGEICLGNRDGFLCCAAAAGPAFEGAEISCGSPAQDGAICRVRRDLSFDTIGGGTPRSICGSGLVDAVAALLHSGVIDETGLLEPERYEFGGGVYLDRGDVRKVQLAKAAIRAGIETLLDKSGRACGDVSQVLVAGGFGTSLDRESACAIGLLPPTLKEKTRYVGNSAGLGAALALDPQQRAELTRIAEKCQYEELSSSPLFNEKYIDAMMFNEI